MSLTLPYAGTSGRVKIAAVAPDLTTDVITYGTPTRNVVKGAMSWSLTPQPLSQFPESLTFESEASTEGLLSPDLYRGGAVKWVANIECEIDDASNQPLRVLQIGTFVVLDLVFKKETGRGYPAVEGRIQSLPIQTGVRAGLATISFTVEVNGTLPAIGTVS